MRRRYSVHPQTSVGDSHDRIHDSENINSTIPLNHKHSFSNDNRSDSISRSIPEPAAEVVGLTPSQMLAMSVGLLSSSHSSGSSHIKDSSHTSSHHSSRSGSSYSAADDMQSSDANLDIMAAVDSATSAANDLSEIDINQADNDNESINSNAKAKLKSMLANLGDNSSDDGNSSETYDYDYDEEGEERLEGSSSHSNSSGDSYAIGDILLDRSSHTIHDNNTSIGNKDTDSDDYSWNDSEPSLEDN